MKIIKLDAIDSTNSFLKELAQNSNLENYTVAYTNKQVSGRGQMNRSWVSEPYKNLTFSIFKRFKNLQISHQSYLNFAISLAIFDTLQKMSVPNLAIKWPNDIMSGNQKICGILIETTFTNTRIKNSVIGIGLNVNQEKFPKNITNAGSLKNLLSKEFDLELILSSLIEQLKGKLELIENNQFDDIYLNYLNHLYKKGIPSTFKDEQTNSLFMGMIISVSKQGKLQVQLEDDSVKEFEIKEISFARV